MTLGPRRLFAGWLVVTLPLAPAAQISTEAREPSFRAHPELRLVGLMHENLESLNRIIEAVAREDFAGIAEEAKHLHANARETKTVRLNRVGLDASRTSRFENHLTRQTRLAQKIEEAAAREDPAGVLVGLRSILDEACVACHQEFRNRTALRKPSVLLMRNFLSATQSMTRGVALDDYSLVARQARQLEAISQVFAWGGLSDALFGIHDPKEQAEFRRYLDRLAAGAVRIEGAAVKRDPSEITAALQRMLREACVGCHERFRKSD